MSAPRRADALDNRHRILQVARRLVAGQSELRLNAVAREAGVGQGTLYRHFPTREALLAEVYQADVAELVEAAQALLSRHDPVTALERWFDRVADYARVKREVFAAVEDAVWQGLAAHSQGPIGDAVSSLLEAGRADGSLRDDVDARDVVILISYLSRLNAEEFELRARRLLRVVLDGLRASG